MYVIVNTLHKDDNKDNNNNNYYYYYYNNYYHIVLLSLVRIYLEVGEVMWILPVT